MELKDKVLASLAKQDLSPNHAEYIRQVVAYIDENAAYKRVALRTPSNMQMYLDSMTELVGNVTGNSTGIDFIDRKGGILEPPYDGSVPPYVDSFICAIAETGGMYRTVLDNKDASAITLPNISESDLEYAEAVARYLDENAKKKMALSMNPDSLSAYINCMLKLAKNVKSKSTNVPEIDVQPENLSADIDTYIAIMAQTGGMYSYVNRTYTHELAEAQNARGNKEEMDR